MFGEVPKPVSRIFLVCFWGSSQCVSRSPNSVFSGVSTACLRGLRNMSLWIPAARLVAIRTVSGQVPKDRHIRFRVWLRLVPESARGSFPSSSCFGSLGRELGTQ